jgi:hypothetical protein
LFRVAFVDFKGDWDRVVEEGAAVVVGDDDVTEEAMELISCPETELTTIRNRNVSRTTTTERLGRRQGSEVDDVGLGEEEDEIKEQEQEEEGRIAAQVRVFTVPCTKTQNLTHTTPRPP